MNSGEVDDGSTPVRRTSRARKVNTRFVGADIDEEYIKLVGRITAPNYSELKSENKDQRSLSIESFSEPDHNDNQNASSNDDEVLRGLHLGNKYVTVNINNLTDDNQHLDPSSNSTLKKIKRGKGVKESPNLTTAEFRPSVIVKYRSSTESETSDISLGSDKKRKLDLENIVEENDFNKKKCDEYDVESRLAEVLNMKPICHSKTDEPILVNSTQKPEIESSYSTSVDNNAKIKEDIETKKFNDSHERVKFKPSSNTKFEQNPAKIIVTSKDDINFGLPGKRLKIVSLKIPVDLQSPNQSFNNQIVISNLKSLELKMIKKDTASLAQAFPNSIIGCKLPSGAALNVKHSSKKNKKETSQSTLFSSDGEDDIPLTKLINKNTFKKSKKSSKEVSKKIKKIAKTKNNLDKVPLTGSKIKKLKKLEGSSVLKQLKNRSINQDDLPLQQLMDTFAKVKKVKLASKEESSAVTLEGIKVAKKIKKPQNLLKFKTHKEHVFKKFKKSETSIVKKKKPMKFRMKFPSLNKMSTKYSDLTNIVVSVGEKEGDYACVTVDKSKVTPNFDSNINSLSDEPQKKYTFVEECIVPGINQGLVLESDFHEPAPKKSKISKKFKDCLAVLDAKSLKADNKVKSKKSQKATTNTNTFSKDNLTIPKNSSVASSIELDNEHSSKSISDILGKQSSKLKLLECERLLNSSEKSQVSSEILTNARNENVTAFIGKDFKNGDKRMDYSPASVDSLHKSNLITEKGSNGKFIETLSIGNIEKEKSSEKHKELSKSFKKSSKVDSVVKVNSKDCSESNIKKEIPKSIDKSSKNLETDNDRVPMEKTLKVENMFNKKKHRSHSSEKRTLKVSDSKSLKSVKNDDKHERNWLRIESEERKETKNRKESRDNYSSTCDNKRETDVKCNIKEATSKMNTSKKGDCVLEIKVEDESKSSGMRKEGLYDKCKTSATDTKHSFELSIMFDEKEYTSKKKNKHRSRHRSRDEQNSSFEAEREQRESKTKSKNSDKKNESICNTTCSSDINRPKSHDDHKSRSHHRDSSRYKKYEKYKYREKFKYGEQKELKKDVNETSTESAVVKIESIGLISPKESHLTNTLHSSINLEKENSFGNNCTVTKSILEIVKQEESPVSKDDENKTKSQKPNRQFENTVYSACKSEVANEAACLLNSSSEIIRERTEIKQEDLAMPSHKDKQYGSREDEKKLHSIKFKEKHDKIQIQQLFEEKPKKENFIVGDNVKICNDKSYKNAIKKDMKIEMEKSYQTKILSNDNDSQTENIVITSNNACRKEVCNEKGNLNNDKKSDCSSVIPKESANNEICKIVFDTKVDGKETGYMMGSCKSSVNEPNYESSTTIVDKVIHGIKSSKASTTDTLLQIGKGKICSDVGSSELNFSKENSNLDIKEKHANVDFKISTKSLFRKKESIGVSRSFGLIGEENDNVDNTLDNVQSKNNQPFKDETNLSSSPKVDFSEGNFNEHTKSYSSTNINNQTNHDNSLTTENDVSDLEDPKLKSKEKLSKPKLRKKPIVSMEDYIHSSVFNTIRYRPDTESVDCDDVPSAKQNNTLSGNGKQGSQSFENLPAGSKSINIDNSSFESKENLCDVRRTEDALLELNKGLLGVIKRNSVTRDDFSNSMHNKMKFVNMNLEDNDNLMHGNLNKSNALDSQESIFTKSKCDRLFEDGILPKPCLQTLNDRNINDEDSPYSLLNSPSGDTDIITKHNEIDLEECIQKPLIASAIDSKHYVRDALTNLTQCELVAEVKDDTKPKYSDNFEKITSSNSSSEVICRYFSTNSAVNDSCFDAGQATLRDDEQDAIPVKQKYPEETKKESDINSTCVIKDEVSGDLHNNEELKLAKPNVMEKSLASKPQKKPVISMHEYLFKSVFPSSGKMSSESPKTSQDIKKKSEKLAKKKEPNDKKLEASSVTSTIQEVPHNLSAIPLPGEECSIAEIKTVSQSEELNLEDNAPFMDFLSALPERTNDNLKIKMDAQSSKDECFLSSVVENKSAQSPLEDELDSSADVLLQKSNTNYQSKFEDVIDEAKCVEPDSTANNERVITEEEKQEIENRNKKIVEERMNAFEHLEENLYLVGKVKSQSYKGDRRMICDCTLSKEEIENDETGCGEDCLNKLLMIECGSRCTLNDRCMNKNFQLKNYAMVEVFNAEEKGCGVRACTDIAPGTFIMEYIGEVFDTREFKRRRKEYAKNSSAHFYFMALNQDRFIDATLKGNISRFINHSCSPNAETQKWTVNGDLRIGFFATKLIASNEEINFDYRLERYGREPQKCYCGTPECRGWLGESPDEKTKEEKEEDRRRELRNKKKRELRSYFGDLDLEYEIEKLNLRGLRNRQDTLNLSRLMVRALESDTRMRLLKMLETGEEACKRLFLDYHGLKLLWSWMADISSSTKNIPLKLEILKSLSALPITNKTQLLESRVLDVVERWSKDLSKASQEVADDKEKLHDLKKHSSTISDKNELSEDSDTDTPDSKDPSPSDTTSPDDSSLDSSETPINSQSDQIMVNLSSQVASDSNLDDDNSSSSSPPDSDSANELSVSEMALKLLPVWDNLKEVFKIPRKERLQMMKEHEREVDQEFKKYLNTNKKTDEDRTQAFYDRWRYGVDKDKDKARKKDKKSDKKKKGKKDKDEEDKNISKEERRERFALQVAQEDEAARQKKLQEDMWTLHLQRCIVLGQDPNYTPIFDPSGQFYWDPHSGAWQPYIGPGGNLPVPATYGANLGLMESLCLNASINQLFNTGAFYPLPCVPALPTTLSIDDMGNSVPKELVLRDSPSVLDPPLVIESLEDFQKAANDASLTSAGILSMTIILPAKWKMASDQLGHLYFYHTKTRYSQWDVPTSDLHEKLMTQYTLTSDSESDSDSDSESSSNSEEFSSDEDDIEKEDKEEVLIQTSPGGDEKMIKRVKGQRRHSEKLVQARVISPILFEDREAARKERKEAKEKAREEARKERWSSYKSSRSSFKESSEICETKESGESINDNEEDGQLDLSMQFVKSRKYKQLYDIKQNTRGKSKERMVTALADNSELARKIKESFKTGMANFIVSVLNPYRRSDCIEGRINNTEDFKYLARKLTHFVMVKELKQLPSVDELDCSESVKHKTKEFVRKYMSKYGSTFKRDPNDTKDYLAL